MLLDRPAGRSSWATDAPPSRPDGIEPRTPFPFVGRSVELAALELGLTAVSRPQGSLFLVSGEAGIGKTHLATELANLARARGMSVHWGRCWEGGATPPYWPWIEVIRQILEDDVTATAGLGHHAQYLGQIAPEVAQASCAGTAPPPGDPESARFLLFDAVAALLRRSAAHRPMLVVIDDFHAADRVSVLLLAFLARTLAESPIQFVGTYRAHEASLTEGLVEPLAELARDARRVALRGLDAPDVGRLIEAIVGSRPDPRLVLDVSRVTEGNPFFVHEVSRLLVTSAGPPSDGSVPLRVPEGVRDAVLRRLKPLPPKSTTVLDLAAVLGRNFDVSTVALAAEIHQIEVVDALDEPVRHGLVEQLEPGRFSFRHALIREAVYGSLSPARRIRIHRAIAEALETASARDPDRYVSELAHHFLAAVPYDDDDRFVTYGIRAARDAMRRMAFEEAVGIYERILDALPSLAPDELRRCELLLALGEARAWTNDEAGCRIAAMQAAAIARQLNAPDLLARAALSVGSIVALKSTATSRCDGSEELLREALQAIPEDEPALRARILCRLALQGLSTGARTEARSLSERAVADARRSNDPETVAHSLIARHAVLFGPDHMGERCAIADEMLELATRLGSREFEMRGHALRATNLLDLGDMRGANEAIDRHRTLANETGDPFERWVSVMWRAGREFLDGRFDAAEVLSREGHEFAQAVPGLQAYEINGPMAYAAQTLLLQDARGTALPDPDVIRYFRERFPEVVAWRVALVLRATRLGRKLEVCDEIEALAARSFGDIDRGGTWLGAMTYLSEGVAFVEDRARAKLLYDLLLPYADRNVTISLVISRGSVSRFLGLLAATMGDVDSAIGHFEAALAMNRRMGARPHLAATLHDYGCMLTRLRAADRRARELLDEASALASEIGIVGLPERCAAVLDAIAPPDGAPRPVPSRPLDGDAFELSRAGRFWKLSRGETHVLLEDRKGFTYIAELVRQPERDVHVMELRALAAPPADHASSDDPSSVAVASKVGASFADDMIDVRARRDYQRRLSELHEQLARYENGGNPEDVLALREEITHVSRELARATSLGGRPRLGSDAERARINVRRAIHLALTHVAEVAPAYGAVLAGRIRTGMFCRYTNEHRPAARPARTDISPRRA